MKSRFFYFAAICLGLGALAWFAFLRPSPSLENESSPSKSATANFGPRSGATTPSAFAPAFAPDSRQADLTSDGRSSLPEIIAVARTLNAPNGSALEDIQILQDLLENYRRINGKNPTGLNFEIVRVLKGDNSKKYAVLPPDLKNINPKGELVDRWGTPYFFHCLNDTVIEIQSAGPDRRFDSPDDIGQITQL